MKCEKVAVFTGAGVSAESGIATFRGAGGMWEKVDPMRVVSIEGFLTDPKFVWECHEAWRRQIGSCEPNKAHEVIAWMEGFFPHVTVSTQNVDGFHQKAGSKRPYELHGNLWILRCVNGCGEWEDRHELIDLPPKCPHCGGMLRPAIVWFGEPLPEEALMASEKAAADCDVLFVVGTSATVYPAASIPEIAILKGRLVIEINPEKTPISGRVTLSVRAKAGEALEALQKELLTHGR